MTSSDSSGRASSTLKCPSKCTWQPPASSWSDLLLPATHADVDGRFVDCEKWRKEFGGGVDELVPTFEYKEKADVFHYYPQYYHKTDKVCLI